MAAEQVQHDSKHRVAYDLMMLMHASNKPAKIDSLYWLKMFEAANSVVNNGGADHAATKLPK